MLLGAAAMVQVAKKAADKVTPAEAATKAIDSTQVVEHHFAQISHTDPLAATCFLIAVGCIVLIVLSVVSDRLKSNVKWLGTMAGRFSLIVLGGFFLLLPIAMHEPAASGPGYLWQGLSESVPAAVYLTFNTMGFAAELESWTAIIHTVMGNGVLSELYFWLLTFYTVASPIALALTAVDVLVNGFTGFLLYTESLRKCVRRRDIYVFYGLNDNTCTLATDLLGRLAADTEDDPRKRMPLLVFCNVSNGSSGDGNSLAQQVRENAYGCATVVFTPIPLENVPGKLAGPTQTRCRMYYLVLSQNADENVQSTIRLCDVFTTQMMTWEMSARHWDARAVGDKPALLPRTEAYARNLRVWCVHDNPDDDLIFDSLPQRKPDDQLMIHMLRHNRDRGPRDQRRAAIEDGLAPLMVLVRNLVEVRLLSEQREVVWDALVSHPLTSVLDPVDVSRGLVQRQQLTVVVFGLGPFGLETVRACFWFGRLPGVELRIIAVDEHARAHADSMAASWPEMVFERVPEGSPSVQGDLEDPLAEATPNGALKPTLAFLEADARSLDVVNLLEGKEVQGLAVSDKGAEPCPLVIGEDARVYTVVALGDDELSLDVALRAQRLLSDRVLAGTLAQPSPPAENPVVSVLVRNQEVLESVRDITHGRERFSLKPFGSTEDAFSYEKILGAPWEDAAINLQAAYLQARKVARGGSARVSHAEAIEAFNSYEIKKLSNRAAIRYTPYRLWCLGLEAENGHPSESTADQWADKLGMERFAMELETRDTSLVRLVCGEDFADTGLDQKDRDARKALVDAAEKGLREKYGAVCRLGDVEHARWCAFLRAQGWRAVEGGFPGLQRMNAFIGAQDKATRPYPHQSMRLMRHYYLEDDPGTFRVRGAECRDDPAAYDRMVVVKCVRAMRCEVIDPATPRVHHRPKGV